MQHGIFTLITAGALALLTVPAAAQQPDHLLLSEIGINPALQAGDTPGSEFVEIFNPTAGQISLDNVYYADDNAYKTLPANPGGLNLGTSDQIVKFPNSSVLQSGQVAVICDGAAEFLHEFYPSDSDPSVGDYAKWQALPGAPLLFEMSDTNPNVPEMISFNTNATLSNSLNMTNAGEFGLLFYWDGTSDLVKDLDIVAWEPLTGTTDNVFHPKTSADTGANGTPYLMDAGSHVGLSIPTANIIARNSVVEVDEVQSGGNGLTGHDESTENGSATWIGRTAELGNPGITNLAAAGENQLPIIERIGQDPVYPAAGEQVNVLVGAKDNDGTITNVTVYYSTDNGGTYTPVSGTANTEGTTFTANLGTFPDGTLVSYYATATDNNGDEATFPITAPTDVRKFYVLADPVVPGDLVINEILFDVIGGDGDAHEFVEIYNNTDGTIDLEGYGFADGNRNYFFFPNGTTIDADSYVIVSLNPTALQDQYTIPPGVEVFDWGTFALNNGGDSLYVVSPNGLDYMGTTQFIDEVDYGVGDDTPWPHTYPNSTGRTYELLNPDLDNALPESWAPALLPLDLSLPSTPGEINSVFTVALVNVAIDPVFPAPNTAFAIDAEVAPIGDATITSVKLFTNTGSGFTSQNMSIDTGSTYTATIAGQPNGTNVLYYLEITNSDGVTTKFPPEGDQRPLAVKVSDVVPQFGDIVINEILYDSIGGDAYEYIELYNNSEQTIDLSQYRLITNGNVPFAFPEGASIDPDEYLVITEAFLPFEANFGPGVADYSWEDAFNLINSGDTIRLIHPNQFSPEGENPPIEFVSYETAAPWPDRADQNPNSTGASLELINPNYADRGTNGTRWKYTTGTNDVTGALGTPGEQNSMFAGVSDWTLY